MYIEQKYKDGEKNGHDKSIKQCVGSDKARNYFSERAGLLSLQKAQGGVQAGAAKVEADKARQGVNCNRFDGTGYFQSGRRQNKKEEQPPPRTALTPPPPTATVRGAGTDKRLPPTPLPPPTAAVLEASSAGSLPLPPPPLQGQGRGQRKITLTEDGERHAAQPPLAARTAALAGDEAGRRRRWLH